MTLCGKQDVYHFFFVFKNYSFARNTLFDSLLMLKLVNFDKNILLCDDINLSLQIDNIVFDAVHKLIDESCTISSLLVFYNRFQSYHFSINFI